jgi:hypothetical protein
MDVMCVSNSYLRPNLSLSWGNFSHALLEYGHCKSQKIFHVGLSVLDVELVPWLLPLMDEEGVNIVVNVMPEA